MCHENVFYSCKLTLGSVKYNFVSISFLTKSLKTMFPKWERWSFSSVLKYPCLATDVQ